MGDVKRDKTELQDRAKECARCMQAMAVESIPLFSNKEYLDAWFIEVFKYEKKQSYADLSEKIDWMMLYDGEFINKYDVLNLLKEEV
tara:strand:+ start:932 stop:1192 length:261 start_codon:yes stop_codon:yes gene_type:complete